MSGMEQEIINPSKPPAAAAQGFSALGCTLAAIGAGLTTLTLLGAAAAASVWALVKLLGLGDTMLYGLLLVSLVPVLLAAFWVTGRAWHVERRLATGLDVDNPHFTMMHYAKRR